ncbi:MAG TPA: cyclic nucleotide-binding domain-containing protein [Actinomycetota bacterium]
MGERGRTGRWSAVLVAGAAIGVVEALTAVAFAALVFGGRIGGSLPDGVGLYLVAASVTLAILAWRAGPRGVVGGLQATGAALLSIVAAKSGLSGSPDTGFLSVVAATALVTLLCGAVFLVLGVRRRADLIRYVPVPVVGGLVAGAGWLLLQGAIHVAIDEPLFYTDLADLVEGRALRQWLPAVAFGVALLLAVRIVRRPLVLPIAIGIGVVGFALVAVAIGASFDDVRAGGWLVGAFTDDLVPDAWGVRAVTEADWLAVARSWAGIAVAVVVAALVLVSDLGAIEPVLDRDLDTDRELRDAGVSNLVVGVIGGIPGAHAPGATSLAAGLRGDARRVGLVAAGVPLVVLLFGTTIVELVPRVVVGGVLAYLGLSCIVAWVWDRRRTLPRIEHVVVLVILAVVVVRGYGSGFVVGLVLAVGMFAVSYARVDLVHEVAFGDAYRSSVDRPPAERGRLRALADRVQILRLRGHVFFGSTDRLLERIRARAEGGAPPRFLVIDLQRVTGVDASAAAALTKAERLAAAHGTEIVLTGASEAVRARLERGGVGGARGLVSFAPDLDDGLRRCEEALLEDAAEADVGGIADRVPPALAPYLDRIPVAAGTVLLRQDEPPGDVYVLSEGRLAVETSTPEGRRVRLRTLRPGVVVGEVALYTGERRTADVVAETACVVLRCPAERVARIEAEDPEAAAALHRWLAGTLAERLDDTMRGFDALID